MLPAFGFLFFIAAQTAPSHDAAGAGDVAKVRQLLGAGANVNQKDAMVGTPLHMAAMSGQADVAELLASADPERGKDLFESSGCGFCLGASGHAPKLWGVVRREKASWPEFNNYSEALKRVGGTWGYEDLNAFLASPTRFAPGNRMSIPVSAVPEFENAADRADLTAYLRLQSDAPEPLPE